MYFFTCNHCKNHYIYSYKTQYLIETTKKVIKTMTYTNKNITVSAEIEFIIHNQRNFSDVKALLGHEITNFCKFKDDASSSDQQVWEINVPPMIANDTARAYYKLIQNKLESLNAKITSACGLHVHMGTRKILDNIDPDTFNRISWNQFFNNTSEVTAMFDYTSQMPLLGLKDIGIRYYTHFDAVNSMLTPTRHDNRYARYLSNFATKINGADSIDALSRIQRNKFYAVNYEPLTTSKETIEFRQRHGTFEMPKIFDWFEFLLNMVTHTLNNRVTLGSGTTQETTTWTRPTRNPFRSNTTYHAIYELISRTGGATAIELEDELNRQGLRWDRARISEMRRDPRLGNNPQAIATYNQQHYNNVYGASNGLYNLNGYELAQEYTITRTLSNNVESFLPDYLLGPDHIHYGLNQDLLRRLIRTT